MISYKIIDTEEFLQGLFREATWDNFFFVRAEFSSFVRAELADAGACKWAQVRPVAAMLLAQDEEEKDFQVTLRPDWDLPGNEVFHGVERVYLHLRFERGEACAVTGISYETFVPGKTAEREWDRLAGLFLKKNHIAFEG